MLQRLAEAKRGLSFNFLYAGNSPSGVMDVNDRQQKTMFAATGLRPSSERTEDLIVLKELIEAEKIKPVIDKHYPWEQIAEAPM